MSVSEVDKIGAKEVAPMLRIDNGSQHNPSLWETVLPPLSFFK